MSSYLRLFSIPSCPNHQVLYARISVFHLANERLRCRKNPGWVKLVLIRKVTDIASIGIVQKNEPERFEKAFAGVPKDVWRVFEGPEECYGLVDELIKTTPA